MKNQAIQRRSFIDSGEFSRSAALDETLLDKFNEHFEMLPADTAERRRLAQQIRHQVYCIEHPHEKADNPEGVETDEFDSHAVHSLLHLRATGCALGTVRLILPLTDDPKHSFAVQQVMDASSLKEFNKLPLYSTGEVSRFSISRQFRLDAKETAAHPGVVSNSGPLMRLGLIRGLIHMSRERGITHWCAAMEPTLLRMLSAMAIRFQPIGPVVDYHGLRQPCYCVIADVLDAVRRERPAFWAVLTNGGAPSRRSPRHATIAWRHTIPLLTRQKRPGCIRLRLRGHYHSRGALPITQEIPPSTMKKMTVSSIQYDDYQRLADEALQMALTARNDEYRVSWLKVAEGWLQMVPPDQIKLPLTPFDIEARGGAG